MERTISGMMGKGSVNHNTRDFTAKNVDMERSGENVEFCHSDLKEIYHILFDEALERYNAKQKRSDRKIFYVSLCCSFKKEILIFMCFQAICIWTSRHRISILILFPLSVTASVGLIQEYR